jgi:hypothetical protein
MTHNNGQQQRFGNINSTAPSTARSQQQPYRSYQGERGGGATPTTPTQPPISHNDFGSMLMHTL